MIGGQGRERYTDAKSGWKSGWAQKSWPRPRKCFIFTAELQRGLEEYL